MLTSIGHRTGLLNALAGQAPLTSQALAEHAGLQERYVREWLGGMVAAEVIETDSATATYWLPDEHAALLTDQGPANLAIYAQFIPLLGSVEDDVVHCFREGGGVPYARYSLSHCMTVSLAQGGEGLGTMWGRERALAYLEAAGFRDIRVHQLEHDIQNDYFVCRL
nr:hypothetical protein [Halomonas cerina]